MVGPVGVQERRAWQAVRCYPEICSCQQCLSTRTVYQICHRKGLDGCELRTVRVNVSLHGVQEFVAEPHEINPIPIVCRMQMACHGADRVDEDRGAMTSIVLVALSKLAFVEERMHRMHPSKVQLEQMIEHRTIRGNSRPSAGGHTAHLLIRSLIHAPRRAPRAQCLDPWRAIQPIHNCVVFLAVLQPFEDFGDFVVGGRQRLQDLLGQVVFGLQLLDLLEQLLLCVLDVYFIRALAGLDPRRAPLARLLAIALVSSAFTLSLTPLPPSRLTGQTHLSPGLLAVDTCIPRDALWHPTSFRSRRRRSLCALLLPLQSARTRCRALRRLVARRASLAKGGADLAETGRHVHSINSTLYRMSISFAAASAWRMHSFCIYMADVWWSSRKASEDGARRTKNEECKSHGATRSNTVLRTWSSTHPNTLPHLTHGPC